MSPCITCLFLGPWESACPPQKGLLAAVGDAHTKAGFLVHPILPFLILSLQSLLLLPWLQQIPGHLLELQLLGLWWTWLFSDGHLQRLCNTGRD